MLYKHIFALLLLQAHRVLSTAPHTMASTHDWRLPRDCIPEEYALTLNPFLESGLYNATVKIRFKNSAPQSTITLHSKGLKFGTSDVQLNNSTVKRVQIHPETETVSVVFENALEPGQHELSIGFTGDMKNRIVGLYRSTYKDENGTSRYIATSKFEPTYARQAFPCFDEPNFKAKFTVNLVKPIGDDYIALSNMNQLGNPEIQPDRKSELVAFNTSVPMSTYVACFIVCDFKYSETSIKAKYGNEVNIKVYATPAQQSKTHLALDIAAKVTEYYINYFSIPYPLPKLDMIAIPDFVSGAMEHWGLITYRETALLYDDATSSVANKKRVAIIVAHEIAHQWFGNLVTMDWWNDLWLNEGFASYMQYKSVDALIPEWNLIDQFLTDMVHPVLNFDATLASHPIVQTVLLPDEITEIFDMISYNKGSALLHMLEDSITSEKFQQGVSRYLKKYKYSNAVTKNLLDELQKDQNDININDFMDTWTIQSGYPIVQVEKQGDLYILSQKRFFIDPENENKGEPSKFNYKWTIPITYITDNDYNRRLVWFDKSKDKIVLEVPNAKWVKFNYQQVGYYRVNYQENEWNTLVANINTMSKSDRIHLLEESFSIAESGQLSYEIPLKMLEYLKKETEYVPWSVASNLILKLKKFLYLESTYSKYQEYIQSLVNPIYETLSWDEKEEDTDLQRQLRFAVLNLACAMGHKQCLGEASKKFKAWLNEKTVLPKSTKECIYTYGIVNATEAEWNLMFEIYKKETDAQEKIKLMKGLASIRNPVILNKLIIQSFDESIVRGQDYLSTLEEISKNTVGLPLIWDHVRNSWLKMVERYTLNDRYLGKLVPGITKGFNTETKLNEILDFFKHYPEAGAGATSRKQALETVSYNIKWMHNYKDSVEKWLNANIKN